MRRSSSSSATSCARAATRRPHSRRTPRRRRSTWKTGMSSSRRPSIGRRRPSLCGSSVATGRRWTSWSRSTSWRRAMSPRRGADRRGESERAVAGQARERPRRLRRRRNIHGLPVAQGLARARTDRSSRRRARAARCRRCTAPSGVAAVSPTGAANARARGGCKHHERDDAHRAARRARSRRKLVLPGGCADAGRPEDAGTRRRHRADAQEDRSADGRSASRPCSFCRGPALGRAVTT